MDLEAVVHRQVAAYNRGDWDEALESVSPSVVWVVSRFEDGLIVRVEEYLDPAEARDAF